MVKKRRLYLLRVWLLRLLSGISFHQMNVPFNKSESLQFFFMYNADGQGILNFFLKQA